jgi:hypothetical protein
MGKFLIVDYLRMANALVLDVECEYVIMNPQQALIVSFDFSG